jgi:hypothetical protein
MSYPIKEVTVLRRPLQLAFPAQSTMLEQRILTEGEVSVQLTSSSRQHGLKKKHKKYFQYKNQLI